MRIINILVALSLVLPTTTIAGTNLFNSSKTVLPKTSECSCPCKPAEIPLTEPNQSDIAVATWANEAIVSAFSYNFVNYNEALQNLSVYFTTEGYKNFQQALDKSNNLEAVKAKRLIVSAVATRAPIILQKGLLNGVYSWRVQMPTLVTYQSSTEFSQQNNLVTILIVRVPTLNAPKGIAISQFVVGEYKDK
ncbi:DotI/IcmL/TraM family protein [Legionella sp. WA2022007384]